MPTFGSKFTSLKVSESVLPYLDLEVDRQVAPSRFGTQGCAADGTADGPDLWRAAASDIIMSRWE